MNTTRRPHPLFLLSCLLLALGMALTAARMPQASRAAPTQAYTFKSVVTGTSGGYVPEIVFNEGERNLIYARTDMGGAYRWSEASQSWTQLMNWVSTDNWNDTGVDALAADPVETNRVYMLVGTYTNDWTPANGAIMRSTDKGNTWTRIGLPFKVGANMLGRAMGPRLVIDPNKNSNLWLGARSGKGLWRSTDYGSTWSQVTFPDVGQYAQVPGDAYQGDIMGLAWITIDPRSGSAGSASQTIYVGVGDPTGTNIYRSTNGGTTWAAVPGQLTCSLSGTTVTCNNGVSWTNTSDTCPQHTGNGYIPHHGVLATDGSLYVSYSDRLGPYDGSIGEVYKLDTATGVWTRVSPVKPPADASCTNAHMGLLTGYGGIAVDKQNPQRILVSELNRWWPDVNFWLSTDGGTTWDPIWDAGWPPVYSHYTGPDISQAPWLNFGRTTAPMGEPLVKLGWMVGSVSIDPFNSGRFFYGTGATVYGATNLTNWDAGGKVDIRSMGRGMEQTSVLGMISPPSGTTRLVSVMGDVGGFVHASLDTPPSEMYSVPYAGTYNDIDYAELTPSFMVRAGTGNPSASQPYRGTAFTYNSGGSWFQGNADPVPGQGGGTVAAAANASRVLWAPNGQPTFFSTDNGNTWTQSQGIPAGAVVASDRVNPSKFYGLAGGSFYVSTNGGVSFTVTATGLPTSGKLRAAPGFEGDVWVLGGNTDSLPAGMWRSTNSGTSFTRLAAVEGGASFGFGKAAPGQTFPAIYAAARIDSVQTLHRSDDAGASWVRITDDQHMYATIQTITGDPTIYGRVYFGTNGLGAIYGDIAGSIPATNTPTRTSTSGPVSPTRTSTGVVSPTRTSTGVVPSPTNTRQPATSTRTSTTPPAANLLLNGGFELDANPVDNKPDSWGTSASIARSTAARRSGSYSLRHSSTGNVTYISSQVVSGIQAGASYRFSGWTNIPATSDTFTYRLELVWRNSSNSGLRTDVVRTFTAANGGTWAEAAGSYVAPTGATNVVVRMNVSSLAATIYADDFSLTRATTPPTATRTSTTQPATPTRTGSGVPASPTSTRVASPTSTTGVPPSPTPTTGGAACSPATAITAPFTFDGTGTLCWQISTIPSYINSWNLTSLTVNGVSFTNLYATPSQLPAKINGSWYISYNSSVSWGHFEVR